MGIVATRVYRPNYVTALDMQTLIGCNRQPAGQQARLVGV